MTQDLTVAHVMGSLSAQQEGGMLDISSPIANLQDADDTSAPSSTVSSTVSSTTQFTSTTAGASWSSTDAPPLLLSVVQADFVSDMIYCPTDLPFCLKNLM